MSKSHATNGGGPHPTLRGARIKPAGRRAATLFAIAAIIVTSGAAFGSRPAVAAASTVEVSMGAGGSGATPASGPGTGGTLISIAGSGFTGASAVVFSAPGAQGSPTGMGVATGITDPCANPMPAVSPGPSGCFAVVSDTLIEAFTPLLPAAGAFAVQVYTESGPVPASPPTPLGADSFTYTATAADHMSPVYTWGDNRYDDQAIDPSLAMYQPLPLGVLGLPGDLGISQVAAGAYHELALGSDGTVWSWGASGQGQLGRGSLTNSTGPGQVAPAPGSGAPVLSGITQVAAAAYHSLALRSDGTVWAWGSDSDGQLGDGGTATAGGWPASDVPVQVQGPGGNGSLTDVTQIAAGGWGDTNHDGFSLALKSDGTVWAWGQNNDGELGNGSTTASGTPVQVQGLSGVVAIAAGGLHALALKSDGTVWAWGDDERGQTADAAALAGAAGSTAADLTPVPVPGPGGTSLTDVSHIAAGAFHSLALKNDGTVWAWGDDSQGQLGSDPAAASYSAVPEQVPFPQGTTVSAVAAGGSALTPETGFSVALDGDGQVWSWGGNDVGQLGQGSSDALPHPAPALVAGLHGVTALAAGGENALTAYAAASTVPGAGGSGNGGGTQTGGTNGDPPVVTSATSPTIYTDGTRRLDIKGNNLSTATKVIYGFPPGTAAPPACPSTGPTTATCYYNVQPGDVAGGDLHPLAPPGADLTNVVVFNPAGSSSPFAVSGITGTQPHIDHVVADASYSDGSHGLIVYGTGFTDVQYVLYGQVAPTQIAPPCAMSGENLLPVQNGSPCVYQLRSIDLYSGSGTPDTQFEPMTPPGADLDHITLLSPMGHSNTAGILNPFGSAPTLTGVSAAGTNPSDHRPLVSITGSNLAHVLYVDFGSVPSPSVTNQTDTSLTAEVPQGTGTVPLIATSFAGSNPTSGTGSLTFTYPVVTHVSAPSTAPDGNPEVAITGSGLASGQPQVFFGSMPSPKVTASSGVVYAEEPYLPPGTPSSMAWQYVVVRTPYGDTQNVGSCSDASNRAPDCAELQPAPASVTAESVSPNPGASSSACQANPGSCAPLYRVFGQALGGVTQVLFGNTPQTGTVSTFPGTSAFGTQIAALVPPGNGTVPVTVVDGVSGRSIPAGTYTYPTITSLVLSGSTAAGGDPIVEVNGAGLTLGSAIPQVYFGTYQSPSVSLGQNGTVLAAAPSLNSNDPGGWKSVTVRSQNGSTTATDCAGGGAPDCFDYPVAGGPGSWSAEFGPSGQPPSPPTYGSTSPAAPVSGTGPSFGNIATQGSWSVVSPGVYRATVTATQAVELNGLRITGQQGQASLTLDTNHLTLTATGTIVVSLAAVNVAGLGTIGPFVIYQGSLTQAWDLGEAGQLFDISGANIAGLPLKYLVGVNFVNGGTQIVSDMALPDILGGGFAYVQFATTANGIDPNSLHITVPDTALGQLVGLHGINLYYDPATGGWGVSAASVADLPGGLSGSLTFANGAVKTGKLTMTSPAIGGLIGLNKVEVDYTSGGPGNEQWSGQATAADGSTVSAHFDYANDQLDSAAVSVPHASLAGGMLEVDGLQASYSSGGNWSISTTGARLAGVADISGSMSITKGVLTSGTLTVSSASIGGLVDIPSFTLSYDGSTPGTNAWAATWPSNSGQTNTVSFKYSDDTLVAGNVTVYDTSVAGLFTLPLVYLNYARNGSVEQWTGGATYNGEQANFAFGWSGGSLTSSSVNLPATSLGGVLSIPAITFSSQGGSQPSWSVSATGNSSLSGSLAVVGGHIRSGSLSLSGASFGGLANLPDMSFSYNNTGAAQTWSVQVGSDSGTVTFQNGTLVSGGLNVSGLSLAGLINVDKLAVSTSGGNWTGNFAVSMAGGDVALGVTVGVDSTGTLQTFTLNGDAELGGFLDVKGLNVTYDPGSDTYGGGVKHFDLPGLGFGAGATIGFTDGMLTQFDVNISLPSPGIALGATGLFLDGGDLHLNSVSPLTFGGNLVLSAGPKVLGNTAALFGNLGVTFRPTGFDATGSLSVVKPGFTLANAEVSLDWGGPSPGITVTGDLGYHFSISNLSASIDAGVKGWLHSDAFGIGAYATASVTASLWFWSWTGQFKVEAAATNLGVGACASADDFGVGFSYDWHGSFHSINGACDLGSIGFSFNARRGRVAASRNGRYAPRDVTTYQTTLPAGLPGEAFTIKGTGAVPSVTLTDPAGNSTDIPADTPSGTFFDNGKYLVVGDPADDTVYVIVYSPAAGQWTITPDQGSAPIASVGNANGLDKDIINASVDNGTGGQRVLGWSALLNPGDQIEYDEVGSTGTQVLTTSSDASGSFKFFPADGPGGTRQITANIIRNGMVVDTRTVATYTAPDPTAPAAPGSVTAVVSGGTAQVAWTPPASDGGSAIQRYIIEPSDGGPGTYEPVGTLAASLPMAPGETEHFSVVALNAVGASSAGVSGDVTNSTVSGGLGDIGTPTNPFNVAAGGSASSTPGTVGPTSGNPLIATLTTPVGGQVGFAAATPTSAPSGYRLVPVGMQITAPIGSANQPLDLRFALDPAVLPAGSDASELTVFRDGVPVGPCVGAGASPDPCVAAIERSGDSIILDVRTVHASTWTFAVAKVSRVAGTDRIGTAVAVSRDAFADGTAGGAVLATSTDFPDALAGAPLAAQVHGPVLLTGQAALDPSVAAELTRAVTPGATVYVLGGVSALSDAVAQQVQSLGFNVQRLAGPDRYATAVAVAETLHNPGAVFLTTGTDFADALTAGDAAAAHGGAVLLTEGAQMPAATAAYLAAHPPTALNAVGGPAAQAAGSQATTVSAGADRYATALAVATRFFPGATGVGLASGTNYPDALAAGPFLASLGEPMLLSDPQSLPTAVASYLSGPGINAIHLFGGPAALAVTPDAPAAATTRGRAAR